MRVQPFYVNIKHCDSMNGVPTKFMASSLPSLCDAHGQHLSKCASSATSAQERIAAGHA